MRRLFRLRNLAILGAIAAVMKARKRRQEWASLSDDEIREKLHTKIGGRVSPEKEAAIQDKVISRIRGRAPA